MVLSRLANLLLDLLRLRIPQIYGDCCCYDGGEQGQYTIEQS